MRRRRARASEGSGTTAMEGIYERDGPGGPSRSVRRRPRRPKVIGVWADLFAGPAAHRLLITAGDVTKMFSVEDQLDALINGLAPRRP